MPAARLHRRRPLRGPGEAGERATEGRPGDAGRQVFRFARLSRLPGLPRLAPRGRPSGLAVGLATTGAGVAGGSGNLANLASLGPTIGAT